MIQMNACMIMGHKNPSQIIRLAKRLRGESCDVYIHLDSQMPDDAVEIVREYTETTNGAYYLTNRLHGVLDRRSLVDIVFLMIAEAKNVENLEDKHYRYFLLFSGQDYPIRNFIQVNEELENTYPKPYIDCTPYSANNWIYHKFRFCKYSIAYHDWITKKFQKGLMRSLFRASAIAWTNILSGLKKDSFAKLTKQNISLYGGSAWWILPDLIIDFIYDCYVKKAEISEIILNESVTPEETYFQTLAMMSGLKDSIEVNPPDMVLQNCKTWAYFFDEGKEFKGHPYIFTMNEFDKLKDSDFWFARKFDENVDSDIMDALDRFVSSETT